MAFKIREFETEGYEDIESVMPAHYHGHTRLAARKAGLNEKQEELAVKLTERLADKGATWDMARDKAVAEADKHFR